MEPAAQLELDAKTWSRENRRLLSHAVETFQETAMWPKLRDLGHDLASEYPAEYLMEQAFAMPSLLGCVEEERLVLNVRGMNEVPESRLLLRIWATLLRMASVRAQTKPHGWSVSIGDVHLVCGEDINCTACILALLTREEWPPKTGMAAGGKHGYQINFDLDVLDEIRDARKTSDLLEIRGSIHSHPSAFSLY